MTHASKCRTNHKNNNKALECEMFLDSLFSNQYFDLSHVEWVKQTASNSKVQYNNLLFGYSDLVEICIDNNINLLFARLLIVNMMNNGIDNSLFNNYMLLIKTDIFESKESVSHRA